MGTEYIVNCATGEQTQRPHTPVVPVPAFVTRHQFKRALSAVNGTKRTQFETWLTNTASEADRDYFRDAALIYRSAPAVENARSAISVNQTAVDNLFIAALQYQE